MAVPVFQLDFSLLLRYVLFHRLGVRHTLGLRVAERVPWNLIRLAPAEGSRLLDFAPLFACKSLIKFIWGLT
jgi:hypothetical protein